MAQFHVDSEAVHLASSRVRASVDSIRSEVSTMQAHLNELQGSWTGQASASFQAVVSEWRATQAQVEQSLESINHALAMAGQNYAEIEESNARMFAL